MSFRQAGMRWPLSRSLGQIGLAAILGTDSLRGAACSGSGVGWVVKRLNFKPPAVCSCGRRAEWVRVTPDLERLTFNKQGASTTTTVVKQSDGQESGTCDTSPTDSALAIECRAPS